MPIGSEGTQVTAWPHLQYLRLELTTQDFGEAQWHALTHLSDLEHLAFGAESRGALRVPPDVQLPQVKILSVLNFPRHPASDLSRMLRTLLPVFPGLRTLRLYGMVNTAISLPP